MTAVVPALDRIAAALLQTSSDAIIATDSEGLITFWNPGARRIFGFGDEDAIGRSLDLIIPEKLRQAHWDGYANVMKTGESRYGADQMLSVPALTSDGRRISVEFTIALVTAPDGAIEGTVAVLRDATARFEEMRELRRALRMSG